MHPLQKILKVIQADEVMDFEIRSYSGRFMYGQECLAITGNNINLLQLGFIIGNYRHVLSELDVYVHDLICRTDSMGLGIVVYFPDIPYVKEDEDEENLFDEP